ncbi:MAG: DnaD domain protein, partial [Microbacteriaceae bacterium]|nr:DnaD domain protein [Microbacteriaceae bacterium]
PPGPKDQVREVFRDARIPLPPVLEPEVQGWLDAGLTVSDIEYVVCEAAKSNRRSIRYVSGIIRRLQRQRAGTVGRPALHVVSGRSGS